MRTSSDDEYLRLILASNKDSAACAQVQALLPTITRSLTRPEARRFANAFLSTIQNVDIVTRGGVYLYTAKGFSVDQPRLERIITKMVRGLFFKEFGRRLPSSHEVMPIFVNALRYRVPLQDVNQFVNTIHQLMVGSTFREVGSRVFCFRYNVNPHAPFQTVWGLTFYGRLHFSALTVSRKQLENAIRGR